MRVVSWATKPSLFTFARTNTEITRSMLTTIVKKRTAAIGIIQIPPPRACSQMS